MLFRTRVIAVALITIASLSIAAQTTNKVPLTHEAMWMMKRVGAPNPSPDEPGEC
jgi:hypothetical protein